MSLKYFSLFLIEIGIFIVYKTYFRNKLDK